MLSLSACRGHFNAWIDKQPGDLQLPATVTRQNSDTSKHEGLLWKEQATEAHSSLHGADQFQTPHPTSEIQQHMRLQTARIRVTPISTCKCTQQKHSPLRPPAQHPTQHGRASAQRMAAGRHDWAAEMGGSTPHAAFEDTRIASHSEEQPQFAASSPLPAGSPAGQGTQQRLTPNARRALNRAFVISFVLAALGVLAVPPLFLQDTAKEVCAVLAACSQWLRRVLTRTQLGDAVGNGSSGYSTCMQKPQGGDAANQEWPLPYVVELTVGPLALVLLRQWSHDPSRAACLQVVASIILHAYVRCARATLHAVPSGVAGLVFGGLELLCSCVRLMGFAALIAATPTWLDVVLGVVSGSIWLLAVLGVVAQGTAALLQGFRTAGSTGNSTTAAA